MFLGIVCSRAALKRVLETPLFPVACWTQRRHASPPHLWSKNSPYLWGVCHLPWHTLWDQLRVLALCLAADNHDISVRDRHGSHCWAHIFAWEPNVECWQESPANSQVLGRRFCLWHCLTVILPFQNQHLRLILTLSTSQVVVYLLGD